MKHLATAVAAMALGLVASADGAKAQAVATGILNCEVAGGVGMIVTSKKTIVCTFQHSTGEIEVYDGYIRKFGLDLGVTDRGSMVWGVFAPSGTDTRQALSGTYGGASAEATVGLGVGANVLYGGSRRTVALQPLSLSGQAGLNVAVGVTDLTLQLRPTEQPPRRRRHG